MTALVETLVGVVGEARVVTHPDALRTYESDGLLAYRASPMVAVLPESTAEVQGIVRACARAGIPWVARGSGTGLSGGAVPVEGGVLIVLSRMRRILAVDLPNERVVAEPGVRNAAITAAVSPTHFYPPDPSSQVVCSLGGNVAENSGGAHCFKYGFTTNYVTGLEVVLPDGDVVTLGGTELDHPGYDLVGAFVGSEGTLGVATTITVRVRRFPAQIRTLVAYFPSIEQAGQAVTDIVGAGVVPAALEIMDRLTIRACEAATHAGHPADAAAALVVEIDGAAGECDGPFAQVEATCQANGCSGIRVAHDEAERQLIWRSRKSAFAAMGRISPDYYVQDGVVPRTMLPAALRRIGELSAHYGLAVANVFHAGDGNLHPLICYDHSIPGEPERAEALAADIIEACVAVGGSLTGEHGIGIDKAKHMGRMFSEADLEAFRRLRCAFDPAGLANPGKVMPTPRLCGEVPGPYRQHPLERAGVAERF